MLHTDRHTERPQYLHVHVPGSAQCTTALIRRRHRRNGRDHLG